MFRFNTTDTWQIAHSHGYSAMILLKHARDIEAQYVENQTRITQVEHGRQEYLDLIGRQVFLTRDLLRVGGASVILFQGMMEALINHALESETALAGVRGSSFRDKWMEALAAVSKPDTSFVNYDEQIYRKFRNPLVHPSDVTATTFDDLQASVLAAGYKEGWTAFGHLYDGLGHPHDPNSWRIMCEAHDVPEFE